MKNSVRVFYDGSGQRLTTKNPYKKICQPKALTQKKTDTFINIIVNCPGLKDHEPMNKTTRSTWNKILQNTKFRQVFIFLSPHYNFLRRRFIVVTT